MGRNGNLASGMFSGRVWTNSCLWGRKIRSLMGRTGGRCTTGGEEEEGEGERERLAMGQICKRTDVRVLTSEGDGDIRGEDGCLGGGWGRKDGGVVEGAEVVVYPGIAHLN